MIFTYNLKEFKGKTLYVSKKAFTTMTMLLMPDPLLDKFGKSLKAIGVETDEDLERKRYDFEYDYKDSFYLGMEKGIGSVGIFKIKNSPIDYLQILKKQEMAKCNFAAGGNVGMGYHLHSWFKTRFYLSFDDIVKIGPLNFGTVSTIRKGLFHSRVEDFFWNGYVKLTTLPPGLVRDDVSELLSSDQHLRNLMTKCLLRERVIKIKTYKPQDIKESQKTNAKVIIESQWKYQKDLFVDKDTFDMYSHIASLIKKTINDLKYHLV